MSQINLQISIEEANLLLEGLGQMPFARVYELVGKIQNQAAEQLKVDEVKEADIAQFESKSVVEA